MASYSSREFRSDADFLPEQILSGDCGSRPSNQPIPADRRQRLANPRWPSSRPSPVSVLTKPSPHTCCPESGSSRARGRFSPDSGTNYRCALKNTACRDRPAVFAFAWSDSRTTRNRAHRIRHLDIPFVPRRALCPRDLFSIPRERNRVRVPLELISPREPRKPTAALPKRRETIDERVCGTPWLDPHAKRSARETQSPCRAVCEARLRTMLPIVLSPRLRVPGRLRPRAANVAPGRRQSDPEPFPGTLRGRDRSLE